MIALDTSSPWNPKTAEPSGLYRICAKCGLRYGHESHVSCPRWKADQAIGNGHPGHELGGFLARRDDSPVFEEEDRFATSALVQCHPQWNGVVRARYDAPGGYAVEVRSQEDVRWVDERKPPSAADLKLERPRLHEKARGFYPCPHCGRVLTVPEDPSKKRGKGRSKPRGAGAGDPCGHAQSCPDQGKLPIPRAITARSSATTLRLVVHLPFELDKTAYRRWGLTLGYSLRTGLRHLYMLDGPEIELEPMWEIEHEGRRAKRGALTFVDAAVGGSGFLEWAASELHLVAQRAIEHLDHPGCETACYRCLKSYNNQRHHESLARLEVMPDLEVLAGAAPASRTLDKTDIADPKPWLDAFDAGVGSPLELDITEAFIDGTFPGAKKGGPPSERPSGARGRRSWRLQTGLVFLSPVGLRALHQRMSRSLAGSAHPIAHERYARRGSLQPAEAGAGLCAKKTLLSASEHHRNTLNTRPPWQRIK